MDHARHMLDLKTDSMLELTYTERKRVHNLKYYTWVEQQGMTVEDLLAKFKSGAGKALDNDRILLSEQTKSDKKGASNAAD